MCGPEQLSCLPTQRGAERSRQNPFHPAAAAVILTSRPSLHDVEIGVHVGAGMHGPCGAAYRRLGLGRGLVGCDNGVGLLARHAAGKDGVIRLSNEVDVV